MAMIRMLQKYGARRAKSPNHGQRFEAQRTLNATTAPTETSAIRKRKI
jgi:hypothetical protein